MIRRFLFLILVIGAVAPNCWAPIQQPPPANHPVLHEASQGELQKMQELQRTQGEIGYVQRTPDNSAVNAEVTDHTAGNNIVAAQSQSSMSESERAKKVLQDAGKRLDEQQSSGSSSWLGTLIFAILGFGTVMGLRTWAAKNIPTGPPSLKPQAEQPSKRQVW